MGNPRLKRHGQTRQRCACGEFLLRSQREFVSIPLAPHRYRVHTSKVCRERENSRPSALGVDRG